MTNHDEGKLPVTLNGEVMPPAKIRAESTVPYPSAPMPDTAMRGIVAIFHRWGMSHIADAIEQQNRAETALVKLHETRLQLAKVEGISGTLDQVRENAKQNMLSKLNHEARARKESEDKHKHELVIAALDRKMELSAKKRQVRIAEELDKQDGVRQVADAKKDATIARRQLLAAQRISKADIERTVLDKLTERHKALEREADAHATARLVDMARRLKEVKVSPPDPIDTFTPAELEDFLSEFERLEQGRGTLSVEVQEGVRRYHQLLLGQRP